MHDRPVLSSAARRCRPGHLAPGARPAPSRL